MSSDRDRILEQALTHELRAAGTPPAGACLDAETLGAWADGGLDPAAMVACEAHVANCARCQALVGSLARSIPVSTESTLGTVGTPGTLGTLALWKWWLAPIAAGVAATTLWMVVPEQPQLAVAPPQEQTKLAVEQPAAAPEAALTAALPATRDQNLARDRVEARDTLAAAARADEAQLRDAAAPKEEDAKREEAKRFAENAAGKRQEAAPAAPPPPAAVALEAPVAGLQKRTNAAIAPIEIPTLDPALGWRIVGDRIERSGDGGKTWTLMRQDRDDRIVAGSAPSNSVCWFVGGAGRVLLTVNAGATFVDVSLAEPLDLASVAATDARNAMVFSVIGRRFRTDDGGRTWRPF
jgi:hypothetical protein